MAERLAAQSSVLTEGLSTRIPRASANRAGAVELGAAAETWSSAETSGVDTELFSGKEPRVPSLGVPYPALNAREPTNRLLTQEKRAECYHEPIYTTTGRQTHGETHMREHMGIGA